jgi:hypothetical protein
MREPILGELYFTNANGYLQTQRAIKKTAEERDAFGKKFRTKCRGMACQAQEQSASMTTPQQHGT